MVGGPSYDATTRHRDVDSAVGDRRRSARRSTSPGWSAPSNTGTGPNIAADPFKTGFAVLPGDVNGDGVVNIVDAIGVRDHMQSFGGSYLIWADVDGSGVIDLTDMTEVRKRIGQVLP